MAKRQMLINYVPGEECRIAIVEDGKLEELYQERASSESHVGNIYKGRVTNVEPSIQAAFIDFGLDRNGFLHISDLHPMYFPGEAREQTERVGEKTPRRDRPPIQKCLRRGQEVLVQVLKEGIGTKGPTLTSYLSIPGRFLVMMPHMEKLGVSRKVDDDEARREMRKILDELNPPKDFGFIIRTAGMGRPKTDLKRDLAYLQRLWKTIDRRRPTIGAVGELYTESDLVIRTIRDVFSTDIDRIIVDNEKAARRAADFLAVANPRSRSNVLVYRDPVPLFNRYQIEKQIENINARTVPLPSGGSLVIDSTEALVAIDVNSGKSRESRDAEMTAYKVNLEATDEICRQLRLRDLGGVIVSDLIDMRDLKHRRAIETRFRNNLKRDRARTRVLPISQFGILEMTRQRMRPSLKTSIYATCAHCAGSGLIKSAESVVLDVMRRLSLVLSHKQVAKVELTVSPDVAFQLLNRKRAQLVDLEAAHDAPVMVRVNADGSLDFVNLAAFDARGSAIDEHIFVASSGEGFEKALADIHTLPRNADEPAVEVDFDDVEDEQDEEQEHDQDQDEDQDQDQQQDEQESAESADEPVAASGDGQQRGRDQQQDQAEGEGEPRRRRRRRGGRRRRERRDGAETEAGNEGGSGSGAGYEVAAAGQDDAGSESSYRGRDAGEADQSPQHDDAVQQTQAAADHREAPAPRDEVAAADDTEAAVDAAVEAAADAADDAGSREPAEMMPPAEKPRRRRRRSKTQRQPAEQSESTEEAAPAPPVPPAPAPAQAAGEHEADRGDAYAVANDVDGNVRDDEPQGEAGAGEAPKRRRRRRGGRGRSKSSRDANANADAGSGDGGDGGEGGEASGDRSSSEFTGSSDSEQPQDTSAAGTS